MDPVLNRKLFADRSARRRLAEMGGIMASSPALMNEVRTFQDGGAVSEMLGRTQPLPGASFEETTARTVRLLLREAKRLLASGNAEAAVPFLQQAASMGSPEAEMLLNRTPPALPPPPIPNVDLGGPPPVPRSPGQQVGDVLRGIFQPVGAGMREALQPIGEAGREIGQPIGEAMRETLQPIGAEMRAATVSPLPGPPDRRAMFEPLGQGFGMPRQPMLAETTGDLARMEAVQSLFPQPDFQTEEERLAGEQLAAEREARRAEDQADRVRANARAAELVGNTDLAAQLNAEAADLSSRARAARPPEMEPRGRSAQPPAPPAAPEMEPRGRNAQPARTLDDLTGAATNAANAFGETGDPAKATDAALQSFGVDPAGNIKDRVKQYQDLFKELLGESDEDKAQEMWLNLAMVGFAIASGTSPNALQNISAGLLEGSKRMAESRAGARERSDRLTSLAITSALDEASEQRAIQREEARYAAEIARQDKLLADRAAAEAAEREANAQLQFDLLSQRHRNALALAQSRSAPAGVGWLSTDAGKAAVSLVEEGVKTGRDLGEVIDGLAVIGPDVPQLYRNAMLQVPVTGAAVDQAPTTPGTVFYDSVEQQYMIVGEDGVPVPYGE